jgi:hypothetical protein
MTSLEDISRAIRDYLSGQLDGDTIVTLIDDAVSSDAVYQFSNPAQEIILEYQNILALFVSDDTKRLDSSLYYGPNQLRENLSDLYNKLRSLPSTFPSAS